MRVGDVKVIVRHPPPPDWERQRVRNDDSLVLEIRHDDVSFLLRGDIGSEVEATLLTGPGRPGHLVLKVPHHGSRTSNSQPFVDALKPSVAIVSAGCHNRFGHPDPAVVRRYTASGTRLLLTGDVGAVTVCSDGRDVGVETLASG